LRLFVGCSSTMSPTLITFPVEKTTNLFVRFRIVFFVQIPFRYSGCQMIRQFIGPICSSRYSRDFSGFRDSGFCLVFHYVYIIVYLGILSTLKITVKITVKSVGFLQQKVWVFYNKISRYFVGVY